jgi:mono/diheme cytochrome c family protein
VTFPCAAPIDDPSLDGGTRFPYDRGCAAGTRCRRRVGVPPRGHRIFSRLRLKPEAVTILRNRARSVAVSVSDLTIPARRVAMRSPIGRHLGVTVMAVLLAGCGQDRPADTTDRAPAAGAPAAPTVTGELPPGITSEMVASGQQLYGTVCVACHGAAGVGTALGPALNDQNWIHIDGELEEIVRITETGVTQPQEYAAPMPRMGGAHFSPEQLQAIGAYVYLLSRGQI